MLELEVGNSQQIQPLLDDQSTTVVAVLRHIGYANSAVLMDIRLDRISIANLGDQEMVAYPIEPGMHILEAEFSGLVAAAFAGEQSINFEIEEGEKKYFVVQMRAGLLSNTITLLEVTRSGFSSLL